MFISIFLIIHTFILISHFLSPFLKQNKTTYYKKKMQGHCLYSTSYIFYFNIISHISIYIDYKLLLGFNAFYFFLYHYTYNSLCIFCYFHMDIHHLGMPFFHRVMTYRLYINLYYISFILPYYFLAQFLDYLYLKDTFFVIH